MPAQSTLPKRPASTVGQILAMPPHWLASYEEFITKNASQVSQIESALRSLTYIIPGRFRDAEIASESIHSFVQLLSLYHDGVLAKAVSKLPMPPVRTAHARYTRFWADKSALYRRVATALQMVVYTQLLCEMSAKRRGGDRARWRVVVLLEAVKAACRLLLLRITRTRQVVSPPLPEREPIPDDADQERSDEEALLQGGSESEFALEDGGSVHGGGMTAREAQDLLRPPAHAREWTMPRTGMSMPSLPESGDISAYLLSRVLTADDIRPATRLLSQLRGVAHAAEVLHVLAPLAYAVALMRSKDKRSWTPWLVGLAVEYAARQLRDTGNAGGLQLRATPLEREEWNKRGWGMLWWTMRGAFYDNVTSGVVRGVSRRMPSFIGGILEDYEYLWENYYFSTSA
ncbi:peroxisomal membrane protein pex16 [Cordyceps fumosorosea ARSEF 2679]|uniref:Peroxisomal membrane protein PEX16 n=1 Tax=Cordyceps fumosorosea (strain ARSEF 2679) TaxID=1081104 RepID=A0A162ICC8_CORFA|nr:peroxisomal membrane protein pex16 [Cordyceps fumosorosea ARSEF 2679]OAA55095.1 peroxisomal membrane protein pex16 [Cordyceps fumosorosea ARSEF 2679]